MARSRSFRPQAPSVQAITVPASVGGINALSSFMEMSPNDCLAAHNLMPVEYGLRMRLGYEEWSTGSNGDIRTVLAYESDDPSTVNDKMWAVTENGIYDVTVFGETSPTEEVSFANQGDSAGYGVECTFSNDASELYFFYADELNGIHQYTEAAGWEVPSAWTYEDPNSAGTQIPFPVDQVAFITVHKLRIWVVLRGETDAWYLPLYSIAGELKKFSFGSKMNHGGMLMGIYGWTLDGGDGVDDYMIIISRAGDLMVYRGGDPEGSDWQQVGSWFIGTVPASRRIVSQYGAEMYALSSFGITSIGDLLRGVDTIASPDTPSSKINRFLRQDVVAGIDRHEWSLFKHPADGFLQITTPKPSTSNYVQYNQNLTTKAWGLWTKVPVLSASTWNGDYFIGGPDGILYRYAGNRDNKKLSGDQGEAINFLILTAYTPAGAHAMYKRVVLIRTIGISSGAFEFNTKAVYDYEVDPTIKVPANIAANAQNVWDSAIWDLDVWDGGSDKFQKTLGSLGMGRAIAIFMQGSTSTRINIVGWDVMYTQGGML